jgi:hypothetical protein
MAPICKSNRMLTHPLRLRGGGDDDGGDNEDVETRRRKRHFYHYTVKQKIAILSTIWA